MKDKQKALVGADNGYEQRKRTRRRRRNARSETETMEAKNEMKSEQVSEDTRSSKARRGTTLFAEAPSRERGGASWKGQEVVGSPSQRKPGQRTRRR